MFPDRLLRVVQLLSRLPGVGEKTAQRYALSLVTGDESTPRELGRELADLRRFVRPCAICGHIAETTEDGAVAVCSICSDPRRDPALLCIVARVQDLLAIERSGSMRGRYFVLGKLLSPLDGIGRDDIRIDELKVRVGGELPPGVDSPRVRASFEPGVRVTEALVATPPSVDGEATALLVARELGAMGVTVSRIASGVPHGGDLEFADQVTLGRAIEHRRRFG